MTARALLFCVVIAAATLAVFEPLRGAGFLQDDHPIVEINPIVARGDLLEIFRTDYWGGVGGSDAELYRPVTIASFALQRGADRRVHPVPAHLLNIALHALTALALGALALRIGAGKLAAALACAMFAIHPIHVSVVAALVGRAEILAALFTLLALLSQSFAGPWSTPGAASTRSGPILSRAAAWGAAACVFLALGSKESALAAPLLLVMLELCFRRRAGAGLARWLVERAAALAPTALALALYLVARTHALGDFPGTQRVRVSENPVAALDGLARASTSLGIAGRALRLLVFPHPLSADYSGNVLRTYATPLALFPLLGLIGLCALAGLALLPLARRGGARASFAASLFLLPYLTVGNLFVLVGIGFAERLLYLPSCGFCLLAGLACAAVAARRPTVRPLLAPALAIAAVILGALTFRAASASTSIEKLFEATLRAAPDSPRANFTLGKIRLDQHRTEDALRLFDAAIAAWPRYSAAWFEKGTIEAQRGDRAAAARSMREAVRSNPEFEQAWRRLGDLLVALGRPAEAAPAYARAQRIAEQERRASASGL